MAVPKSKISRKRTSEQRATKARAKSRKTAAALASDPFTGERVLRHHVSPSGYYRGKVMVPKLANKPADTNDE